MALNDFVRHSLKTRITLATLAIFLASLWSLSIYTSRIMREDMERLLGGQQLSTASLIAAQVNRELEDRLATLETVSRLAGGERSHAGPARMQALIDQRPDLHALFNSGVFVTSIDGTVIADFPLLTGRVGLNLMDRDYVVGALEGGKATIGRPVVGKITRMPVIVMAVPIRDAQGQVIGALGGSISLDVPNFLDEITASHYGKTGGYLIVAPQYRLIVTATDKNRIMETLPAPGVNGTLAACRS